MLTVTNKGDNSEKESFIYYHRVDFDGKMSAMTICNKEVGKKHLIGSNHDDKFDFSVITKDALVYIVDFSFKTEDFKKLLQITKNIIWLDHHKVNYESLYKDIPELKELNGYRDDRFAGCELTWLWFDKSFTLDKFFKLDLFKLELPQMIYLLGRYDIWDKKREEFETTIKDFQFGLRIKNTNMLEQEGYNTMLEIYKNMNSNFYISNIKNIGKNIRIYETQKIIPRLKLLKNETDFEGLKVCSINTFETSSDAFGDAINEYDICATYFYIPSDKNWDIHLYSANPNVHVGEICKRFGGGGHKGAGGCRMSFDDVKNYFLT